MAEASINNCSMFEEQLYGRKKETEYLVKILHSVLNENKVVSPSENVSATATEVRTSGNDFGRQHKLNFQFVLVCGPSCSGKRTFVHSVLKQNLGSSSGSTFLLASGRFRPSRHPSNAENAVDEETCLVDDRPFAAFDEAILEILDVTLGNIEMKTTIHQKLQQVLNDPDDFEIITNAYPSIKRWLQMDANPQVVESSSLMDSISPKALLRTPVLKPVLIGPELVAQQSQVRSPVLIRFLQAVVSYIPLVLLLENLQYADEASLNLIEALMKNNEVAEDSNGLLIVATSHEQKSLATGSSDLFTAFLHRCSDMRVIPDSDWGYSKPNSEECIPATKWRFRNRCFHQICLSDLTWDDVFEWVQAARGEVYQLCSIQQKREIATLAFHHFDGNLLRLRLCLLFLGFDSSILQETTEINKKLVPKAISKLYAAVLMEQDAEVQNVVKVAASIAPFGGGNVRLDILETAVDAPCIEAIVFAHRFGLLEYVPTREYVRFSHEELQKVAYDGIPSINRASLHLDIGRRIWKSALEEKKYANNDENVGKVLLATQQIGNSVQLLVDFEERLYMAQLCFDAGQKSSAGGDCHTAAKLLEFALLVLGPALWRVDLYETSLVLHNAAAQAYYSIGDRRKMEETLDSVFDHASSFRDKLSAYIILVYATGSGLKQLEAFRTACLVLHQLGEPVNQDPNTLTVIAHLIGTKAVLYGKSDSFFRNLPISEDAEYLLVSQFLVFALFFSYVVSAEIGLLICFRLVRLSLKKGITGPTVVALSAYGFIMTSVGSFEEGYRYGQLACELVDKFEVWRPRVRYLLYGYTYYWFHPFRDCGEPLHQCQHSALKNGDSEIYAGSTFYYFLVQLSVGSSLCTLESSARSFCGSLDRFAQKHALLFSLPIWGFICDLVVDTEPLNMKGEIKDSASALNYAVKEGNTYVVGNIYMLHTMWHYLVGEYSEALQMARKSAEYRQVCDHNLTFYEALASLAVAASSERLPRRKYRKRARILTKRMKAWARRCPENFLNKQLLLEAESAALNGNIEKALSLFGQSIDKAKEEGFCHEEGIAHERLGNYQLSIGHVSNATMSFERARAAFEIWGATALVNRMVKLIEQL